MNLIFRTLLIEFQYYYPELLQRCYILNAPMFFEGFYDSEVKSHLSANTVQKISITGESSHKDLIENVLPEELPTIYGG